MAPEVRRGQDATPAADVYALGVMFFHLLTGLWYEPGTKALALLDGFKYRWRDVLSRMLSVDPHERPLPLSDMPRQLLPVASPGNPVPVQEKTTATRFAFVKRGWFIAFVAVAVVAVATVAVVAFSSKNNEPPPPAQDDFGELFSSDDVFRPGEGGK